MVSPPVMVGACVGASVTVTAFRKCTRSSVLWVLATSTKSMPLTTLEARTWARRSRVAAAMSAHLHGGLLHGLGLQQRVGDLHDDLRIVAVGTRPDGDGLHLDLVAEPQAEAAL